MFPGSSGGISKGHGWNWSKDSHPYLDHCVTNIPHLFPLEDSQTLEYHHHHRQLLQRTYCMQHKTQLWGYDEMLKTWSKARCDKHCHPIHLLQGPH